MQIPILEEHLKAKYFPFKYFRQGSVKKAVS